MPVNSNLQADAAGALEQTRHQEESSEEISAQEPDRSPHPSIQPATSWLSGNIPLVQQDPGYPRAGGRYYLDVFADLHARLDLDWYLEIGTETGKGLVDVRANVISVDPTFQLRYDVIGSKGEVHLFQQTSDAFFASGYLEKIGITIDIAFLDGMHLFEFLLRDFLNTERHMKPGGRVMMHDCIPFNRSMAARERGRLDVPWTGDVWKILPILAAYRPDLKVTALDASPTGVILIENLDPESRTLRENYDTIVADYALLTLEEFGLARFCRSFPVIGSAILIDAGVR
jgi:hypothetical protein